MTRAARYRVTTVVGAILLLEFLCRIGIIDHLTMPPPSEILRDLGAMLASGAMKGAMLKTLLNVSIAFSLAVVVGIAVGVMLHGRRLLRQGLDPLFATYYAIPVFAFYPLLIILFGLGDTPQILIGFMLAVVAVIMSTLNGLDRVSWVLLKTARIHRLGWIATALKITLPCAASEADICRISLGIGRIGSLILLNFIIETRTPSSSGSAPPESEVPAPRATTFTFLVTIGEHNPTCSTLSGRTTTIGSAR